jgi:starch synthase
MGVDQMEFWGRISFLKGGINAADLITTVSPRYAEEIQTAPLGCGLEGVLQNRRDVLSGIVNGVDYREWNPALDPNLPATFGPDNLDGKRVCKARLQQALGLPARAEVPLVAFIGRLAEQKGIDLLTSVVRDWVLSHDVQWVILGTGDATYQEAFSMLAGRFPQKVAARLEFSDAMAHQIEAGADIFAMPSRFEPCGLNQLYSLKYGTVPVVRATGGLVDTIVDANDKNLAAGTATGFCFGEYSSFSLAEALERACKAFANQETWRRVMETGMRQDWSWAASARQYDELYRATARRARSGLVTDTA